MTSVMYLGNCLIQFSFCPKQTMKYLKSQTNERFILCEVCVLFKYVPPLGGQDLKKVPKNVGLDPILY